MPREKGGLGVGFCVATFYPATRLMARRRVEGIEHVPPDGPALLVCNHVSYLDPLYTAILVHQAGRVPRFMAKAGLWKLPVLGRVLRSAEQIPVQRAGRAAGDSLRAAERALADGKIVLIYPEGTITRDPDRWPMQSRTGVARLALAADVPVVPVVHWGTQRVYDHYRKRFRPLPRTEVVVRAGQPVDLAAHRTGRPPDGATLRAVTDLLMGRVRDLLADVRGAQPPAEFFAPQPSAQQPRRGPA